MVERIRRFAQGSARTTTGEQMTRNNTHEAVATRGDAPAQPVVLFSDVMSAVMSPLPGPARRPQRPLETLRWQAPPALEDEHDPS
ncbi:hypothetical protein ACFQ64_19540 [Streptomyces sp. NPDC056460]|uniref:hypothetical protein n=1 Tax=Streptomyces sp. NPDC056460 TaxID=3345825 RepID=UPI0036A7FD08